MLNLVFILLSWTLLLLSNIVSVNMTLIPRNLAQDIADPATTSHRLLILETECRYVHKLRKDVDVCEWVRDTEDCRTSDGHFKYTHLIYCSFEEPYRKAVGLPILILWMLFLFTVLGITASEFFCPSLTVLAKALNMSENVAGVTVLAIGNGSPDLFTSFVATATGETHVMFALLFGSGIFITTFLVGLVCLLHPFKLQAWPFLRDSLFYLIAIQWTFYVFYQENITLYHTLGFIILYLCYLTAVLLRKGPKRRLTRVRSYTSGEMEILQEFMEQNPPNTDEEDRAALKGRKKKRKRKRKHKREDGSSSKSPSSLPEAADRSDARASRAYSSPQQRGRSFLLTALPPVIPEEPEQEPETKWSWFRNTLLNSRAGFRSSNRTGTIHFQSIAEDNLTMSDRKQCYGSRSLARSVFHHGSRTKRLCMELIYEIFPIINEDWPTLSWKSKASRLFQMPIIMVLKLLIPVVNYEADNNGWCKLLNTLHCLFTPLYIIFATGIALTEVMPGIHVIFLVVLLGVSMGITVFYTTLLNLPPKYHIGFSALGFAGSVLTVYLLVTEIVSIAHVIGVMININDITLGLTILAWGNSLGDIISTLTLSRAGFQKMAFASCFGGPLFNMLLGIGTPLLILTAKQKDFSFDIRYGDQGPTCIVFITCSIVSSIVSFPLMNFEARRSYGAYLLILYGAFVLVCTLVDMNVIHPYGTDHGTDILLNDSGFQDDFDHDA